MSACSFCFSVAVLLARQAHSGRIQGRARDPPKTFLFCPDLVDLLDLRGLQGLDLAVQRASQRMVNFSRALAPETPNPKP